MPPDKQRKKKKERPIEVMTLSDSDEEREEQSTSDEEAARQSKAKAKSKGKGKADQKKGGVRYFSDDKKNDKVNKNVIKGRPAAKKPRKVSPEPDSSDEDAVARAKAKKSKGKAKSKRRQWEKEQMEAELEEMTTDEEAPKERKKRAPISADKLLAREHRYDQEQWQLLQELLEERPTKPRGWANYDDDEKAAWRHNRDLIDIRNSTIQKDFNFRYKIRDSARQKKWKQRGDRPESDTDKEEANSSEEDQLDSEQEEEEPQPQRANAGPSKQKKKEKKREKRARPTSDEEEQPDVKPFARDEEDVKPDINLLAQAAEARARKEHSHTGEEWACQSCTLWNLWNDLDCTACGGSQAGAREWRKYDPVTDASGALVLD